MIFGYLDFIHLNHVKCQSMRNSYFTLIIFSIALFNISCKLEKQQMFVNDDITNFWKAYDKIVQTTDKDEQLNILKREFITKASKGQKRMFKLRRYTPKEYVDAINKYPLFWSSIRNNMLKSSSYGKEILKGISSFREIYPNMKIATIYFTVGVFRSPGTTLDSDVLIGSEFAFGDKNVVTSEFPDDMQYVVDYFKNDPINEIAFLNVHEYVHTQQKSAVGESLLTQCLREGVAEFIAEKSMLSPSSSPAIKFGRENKEAVINAFKSFMFNKDYSYWLWSTKENQFNQRDLGYFVGYEIAEKYYYKNGESQEAIRQLIELDYTDFDQVKRTVNASHYFDINVEEIKKTNEAERPKVISIDQFDNGSQNVNPNIKHVTINFSAEMDINKRGFDFGDLGAGGVLKVKEFLGFSDDRKSMTIAVSLKPNKAYQVVLSDDFQDMRGLKLHPFLIDIRTHK